MKSQEAILAEIQHDIRMTTTKRKYVYAGEYAGWLDHAAKLLLKIEDKDVRDALFLKIVNRTLKILRWVDDSNASLQSVLWEGGYCFDAWKLICQTSDISCIKAILKEVLPEDEEGLADGLFFPESDLPIPEPGLRELLDYVLHDLTIQKKHRREMIVVGCLGWLAQLRDEDGFHELMKGTKISYYGVESKLFNLYLRLGRYDDAVRLAQKYNASNPRYVHELMLQVFERSGDRGLLLKTALEMARYRPNIEEFKRLDPLLNQDERAQFVAEMMKAVLNKPEFNVPFCEILFAAGELKALHEYAVARYREIYNANACTGMIPLGKKLFKAGDPLAACVFMRGAIYYLMSKNNSKYYPDVHVYLNTLANMAASVTDWETVETQSVFDSYFATDFASRRSFWR